MGSTTFKATFLGDASQLNKEVGGIGSALGGVAKIAGGFVLAQGILKAPGALMDMAKAAAEDEAATMRLNQALQNLGGDVAANTAKVNERIAAGQKLAFSDDDIRDSFQSLAAATGDTDEALARQSAAMDLARGAGIPLATATKMLGKLNEENVEVFKKMGIVLGENATEADALAAVQQKFGGQSETFAKSTAGQFEQLKIRLSEAKETIGAALIPVMAKVGTVLANEVVPRIEEFAAAVGPKLKEGFAFFKTDILPALQDIGAAIQEHVLPPLQQLAEWFTSNGEAMKAAGVAIGAVLVVAFTAWAIAAGAAAIATIAAAAPVIAIAAVVAVLAAGIYLLIANWDTITAKVPALGVAFDAVKVAMEATASWITGTLLPALLLIGSTSVDVGAAVVSAFQTAWGLIEPIVKPVIDQVVDYIRFIADVVQEVFSLVINLIQGDWAGAWDDAKDIIGAFKTFGEETLNNFLAFLSGLAGLALTAAKALGTAIWEGLVAGIGNLYELGKGILNDMIRGITEVGGQLIQKAKDIAGEIGSALNPKNWLGSPRGLQNWYPYYLNQGLDNMYRAAVASDAPERTAAAINAGLHPVIVGGQIVSGAAYGGGDLATISPELAAALAPYLDTGDGRIDVGLLEEFIDAMPDAMRMAVFKATGDYWDGGSWHGPLTDVLEESGRRVAEDASIYNRDQTARQNARIVGAQAETTAAVTRTAEELGAYIAALQKQVELFPELADTLGQRIIDAFAELSAVLRAEGFAGTPPPIDYATLNPAVGAINPDTGRMTYGQPGVEIDPQATWNPKTGQWEHRVIPAAGPRPVQQMTEWEQNIGYVGSGNAPTYGEPFQSAGGALAGGGANVRIDTIQINLGAGAGKQQGEDAANGFLGVLRSRGVMT